ncbi:MAG: hypothetical protein LUD27_07210 [Clostridia bacterium]|nr:hypothetical protein [Clostridia bacterium]
MKKFFMLIATLILTMCIFLSGCGVISQKIDSGTSSGSSSSGSSSPGSEGISSDAYTVTLVLPDGVSSMPDLTGIQAKWTSSTSVYTADFDSSGFAYCEGLDGAYDVTISGYIDGYSYNPNIYDTSSGKDVNIQLIALQDFHGEDGSSAKDEGLAYAYEEGVYRIEFTKANQRFHFLFAPNITTTGYTYSVETYADTIENEINPTLYLYLKSTREIMGGNSSTITGGSDYNGSYTKNVYYEQDMSDYTSSSSNPYIYVFGIKSTNSEYPKYLDICITKEGVYSDDDYWESVGGKYTAAETEDYNSDYAAPTGAITWISDLVSDSSYAHQYDFSYLETYYDSTTKYWYLDWNGERYLIFVELKSCHYPYTGEEGYSRTIYNFYSISSLCGSTGVYYTSVITDYLTTATTEGYHPVTPQLQTFLYDFSAGNLFFDNTGYGSMENLGFTSNDSNQWLFACGIYLSDPV